MLSSLTKNARKAARKSGRFIHLGLAAMALLTIASPTLAASPAEPPASLANAAVQGQSADPQSPNATCPQNGQCFADVDSNNPFYVFINRVYQQDIVSGYACGGLNEPCDQYNRPYYRPANSITRQGMAKFIDNARRLPGIDIEMNSGTTPIIARNDTGTAIVAHSTSGQAFIALSQSDWAIYAQTGDTVAINALAASTNQGVGVRGTGYLGVEGISLSTHGAGVNGVGSNASTGVEGESESGYGVVGINHGGSDASGVYGSSDGSNPGVYGRSDDGVGVSGYSFTGMAGYFDGNVTVTGNCCAMAAASTQIDDPLDPANKVLNQSLVQSPDMTTVINGNVTTGEGGEATVNLPAWFETANGDFLYQLTAIGQFSQAIISQKVKDGKFVIKTDKPNVEVSWQVTGIRQDPFAKAHRLQVEQDKPASEQGKYLHPTEYGQPASAGVNYEAQQRLQQSQASKP